MFCCAQNVTRNMLRLMYGSCSSCTNPIKEIYVDNILPRLDEYLYLAVQTTAFGSPLTTKPVGATRVERRQLGSYYFIFFGCCFFLHYKALYNF